MRFRKNIFRGSPPFIDAILRQHTITIVEIFEKGDNLKKYFLCCAFFDIAFRRHIITIVEILKKGTKSQKNFFSMKTHFYRGA